jgi:hypothetical protein
MALDIKDIPGASPTDLKKIRGLKRSNFFPNMKNMNDYYNKETHGGNISEKAYFNNNTLEHKLKIESERLEKTSHRYIVKRNLISKSTKNVLE